MTAGALGGVDPRNNDATPATLTASLHVEPGQVAVQDTPTGTVSLVLGDRNANVAVLATLDGLTEILAEAISQVAGIGIARKDAGR